jgi:alkanesulfonate monooxygenase SsuD/methylene tetrahydromethanopterin reductase-like flavin-dependent oxidoreductase (luciferase family)
VAGVPIVITNDPASARETIGKQLVMYGQLPSYRAMLDREGAAGPADVALAGDEAEVGAALDRLRDIGLTDFNAAIMPIEEGAGERTLEFLKSRI